MSLWSQIFPLSRKLISRTYYDTPGTQTITVPAGAAYMRVSGVGAGGWNSAMPALPGGGAAFSRLKTAVTPAATYTLKVGDAQHTYSSSGSGDSQGDSSLTRDSDSTVIWKAARGKGGGSSSHGLASDCIGDTKRDGFAEDGGIKGGASGGDDADPYPLGFGGRGVDGGSVRGRSQPYAPAPGAGGIWGFVAYDNLAGYAISQVMAAGNGRVCIEFFNADPGYA